MVVVVVVLALVVVFHWYFPESHETTMLTFGHLLMPAAKRLNFHARFH